MTTALEEPDIASLHIKNTSTTEVNSDTPIDGQVKVWRIENFEKVPLKLEEYGHFYDGDSYIVLYTYTEGTSSAEKYVIYFWQGNQSSKDETGSSAILTTMLDEEMGGTPIQVRVCQGKEPSHFKALFNGSMIIHFGGVASGFKNVDDEDEEDVDGVALYHVHGNNDRDTYGIFTEEKASSLTSRDCFVLVNRKKLFLWQGAGSNDAERSAALKIAQKLQVKFNCKSEPTVIEEGSETARFWDALGGKGEYPKERHVSVLVEEPRLFHCSNMTGFWQVEEVDNFAQSDMNDDDVMLLDVGTTLFVWIGTGANEYERRRCKETALEYIETSNTMTKSTPIVNVESGSEPPMFTQYFPGWDHSYLQKLKFVDVQSKLAAEKASKEQKEEAPLDPTTEYAKNVFSRNVSQSDAEKVSRSAESYYEKMHGSGKGGSKKVDIDYNALHQTTSQSEALVDDGTGKVQVWRIENFEKVPVDDSMHGQFFDGDSYIVLYSYTVSPSTAEKHIIYFWQGNHSSQDEKGSSALEASWLDDELGGAPVQVRVTQGKEPIHFRLIFKGAMIIHKGGVASGFKNVNDIDEIDDDGVSLYHVHGKSSNDTMAIYVEEKAASLTSRDCFVLLHGRSTTLWVGSGSNNEEVIAGAKVASIISKGKVVKKVNEGQEPSEFWEALGGKGSYAKARQEVFELERPRLFKCSDALGAFNITEISPFSQEDLDDTDVMMLDTGSNLFIWVGSHANEDERAKSVDSAEKYLNAAPGDKRSANTIVKVFSNEEPPTFTQFFPGWDPTLLSRTKFIDPLEKKREKEDKRQERNNQGMVSGAVIDHKEEARSNELDKAASREQQLTDSEFFEKFSMTKLDFEKLPKWKQVQKKKEVGLF